MWTKLSAVIVSVVTLTADLGSPDQQRQAAVIVEADALSGNRCLSGVMPSMTLEIGPLLEMSAVVTGSKSLPRISTSRRSAASTHGILCRAN